MSAIQNIKNFIRHGKQAKVSNAEPTSHVSNVHAQPAAISDPNVVDHNRGLQPSHGLPDGFSAAAGDNRNVAAKAADAAAHVAAQNQNKGTNANRKDVDPAVLEQIIAEERASKGKLPKYPGLERWTLLEKMGDGAFSNVYRAKDTHGQYEQVAIKVVRKFEMNSGQVRKDINVFRLLFPSSPVDAFPPPFQGPAFSQLLKSESFTNLIFSI
jgi:serine/threonine-protein kinase RCK2